MTDWLTIIKQAKKSSIVQNNLKKVHYELEGSKEMVEEYNLDTEVLTRRAWRNKTDLGGEGQWEIEIGDPEPEYMKGEILLIKENPDQPFISKRITKRSIEWRIRNLPYPVDIYSVTAEAAEKCLIVRTSNKKYFKKITIPELERARVLPQQECVEFTHKFSTLIITYKKPPELVDLEKKIFEEIKKVKARKEGDMDCKPS